MVSVKNNTRDLIVAGYTVGIIKEIEVAGFEVGIFSYGHRAFFYPKFNENALFRVSSEGFKELSHYLRTIRYVFRNKELAYVLRVLLSKHTYKTGIFDDL